MSRERKEFNHTQTSQKIPTTLCSFALIRFHSTRTRTHIFLGSLLLDLNSEDCVKIRRGMSRICNYISLKYYAHSPRSLNISHADISKLAVSVVIENNEVAGQFDSFYLDRRKR